MTAMRASAFQNEFMVDGLADGKAVLAVFRETIAFIQALRTEILRPDTDVEWLAAFALQPAGCRSQQTRAEPQIVVPGVDVEILDLARHRLEVLHRQFAGADENEADHFITEHSEPHTRRRIRELLAAVLDGVALREELLQILRRIQV